MRAISAYLSLCSLLLACGTSSKNQTNVIFIVVPPPDGDVGCVGVAGFEVTISSGGRTSPSGPLLNDAGPVRESSACHLRHPFSLTDLDLESPASVTVTGYDGAGMARVQAIGHLDNLHANPPHLQLKSITTPPLPVLIINRNPLLG